MARRIVYVNLAVFLLAALLSCDSSDSPVGTDVDVLQWEAERAAMILGYDPETSPEMVARIGHDISRIREKFGRRLDIDRHRVHYPWNPFETAVDFTAEGERLLESGNWPELDAALASLGADSIGGFPGRRYVNSTDPISPCDVKRELEGLEHVEGVWTLWYIFICDDPCGFIWPIPTGEGMDYWFEYRFDGDSTTDPDPREYHYFSARDREDVRYVGSYLPSEYPTPYDEAKPWWWDRLSRHALYGCD